MAGRDPRLVHRRADTGRADGLRAVDGPDRPGRSVGPPGHPGPARDAGLPADLRPMAAGAGPNAGGSTSAPHQGHRRPARSSSSPAASSPSPSSTGRRGSIRKPGRPAAWLRLSTDGGATWPGDVLVAHHPDDAIYYWDQRLETHPDDGRLVNMFWTRDVAAALDIDVHIAWGTPDGRDWTVPVGTGLPGQHCQPISLGGDRLLAVYSHRGDPPGIRAALSEDFGRTWDRASEIVVWASDAGGEPGAGRPRSQDEYWNDMGAWQFGHPRGATAPRWRGARGVLRRQRRNEERALGASFGYEPDPAAARGAGRRRARSPARDARHPGPRRPHRGDRRRASTPTRCRGDRARRGGGSAPG